MSWLKEHNNTDPMDYMLYIDFWDKFFDAINEVYSPMLRYNTWAELRLSEVTYLEHNIVESIDHYITNLK